MHTDGNANLAVRDGSPQVQPPEVLREAGGLEPCEFARGPVRAGLPKLRSGGVQYQAEEHVAKSFLHEAPVGRLSRDRNTHLVARCGDVEADVDQLAEAGRDIAISTSEGIASLVFR